MKVIVIDFFSQKYKSRNPIRIWRVLRFLYSGNRLGYKTQEVTKQLTLVTPYKFVSRVFKVAL